MWHQDDLEKRIQRQWGNFSDILKNNDLFVIRGKRNENHVKYWPNTGKTLARVNTEDRKYTQWPQRPGKEDFRAKRWNYQVTSFSGIW